MIPNVDDKILTSEFDMKSVSAPKPEAPWIKRCDFGIKFTDEIQELDVPLASDTEESTAKDNDQKNSGDEDEEDEEDEEEETETRK